MKPENILLDYKVCSPQLASCYYLFAIDNVFTISTINFEQSLNVKTMFFSRQGHIVLTDFGLCKEGIESSGTTSTFCGTPEVILYNNLKQLSLCHHKFIDLFAKSSFREIRTNKIEIFLRMFMASRVIKNPWSIFNGNLCL